MWLAKWYELSTDNVMRVRQRACASEQRALDEVEKLEREWAPLEWEVSVHDLLAASTSVRRACKLMAAGAVTFVNPQLPRLSARARRRAESAADAAADRLGGLVPGGLWLTGGMAACADLCQGGPPQGHRGSHREIMAELRRYELLFGESAAWLWQFGKPGVCGCSDASVAHRLLQQYGLLSNQHVPQAWLCDTLDVRRRILAGIVDGAGCRSDSCSNCYEISARQLRLAQGYKQVGASLGLRTGKIRVIKSVHKLTGQAHDNHQLVVSGHVQAVSLHMVCSSKQSPQFGAADYFAPSSDSRCYGFSITPQPIGEYFGFAVHGGCQPALPAGRLHHHSTTSAQPRSHARHPPQPLAAADAADLCPRCVLWWCRPWWLSWPCCGCGQLIPA